METADRPLVSPGQSLSGQSPSSQTSTTDLLIIGGGVMGLWAAVKAGRLGIRTMLVEAGRPGQGASNGLIGALMPHMPDRWTDKKQFQFDALVTLEDEVARLEAETGLSCGYRRTGRLIPLPKPHLAGIALGHGRDAATHWQSGARHFAWNLLDQTPDPSWLAASAGTAGVVHDTLAAHAAPRAFVSALLAAVRGMPQVTLVEDSAVLHLEREAAVLADGRRIAFGHAVVANGYRAFALLEGLGPPLRRPLGMAVKGQSALLKADLDPALPVIFLSGLYVVAHEGGHVAVGSSSENAFDDPFSTDDKLDPLIARARDLSPALADAPVVERWAGLRPKAIDRDPMVGPHPDCPRVLALAGGFKVSFGLAHRLADAVLEVAAGRPPQVPESFLLANHLTVARA